MSENTIEILHENDSQQITTSNRGAMSLKLSR